MIITQRDLHVDVDLQSITFSEGQAGISLKPVVEQDEGSCR